MTVASIKGASQPGSAMSNLYVLRFRGLPPIGFTTVGAIEQKIGMAKMPDGSWQTTGKVEGIEVEVKLLLHHVVERLAVLAKFRETRAGAPTYKMAGTLDLVNPAGVPIVSFSLAGAAFSGWALPELAAAEEGKPIELACTLHVDAAEPL